MNATTKAHQRACSSRHRAKRLVSRPAASDAEYFAANPDHRFRFSARLNRKTGYFTFNITTRGGAHIRGDVYDLRPCLWRFTGTPCARLLKALRWMALRYPHRVVQDAPDLVCSRHATTSEFGKWVAAH